MSRARRTVLTVATGHFFVDFTAQLVTMMYPLLAVTLDLSLGLIGVAALVWATASSVPQPLFGYLGDRIGRRWLAGAGLVWMAGWIGAAALAPTYLLLVVFLGLGGLGSAAFHPQGAATANEAATARKGASVATFFFGGHLGFSVSPLVAGAILAAGGVRWVPAVAAPALLGAVLLIVGLRGRVVHGAIPGAAPVETPRGRAGAIGAVLAVVLVRGWAYASLNTFIPIFVSPQRPDPTRAGLVLAAFLAGHALGALSGGITTDRLGVRRVVGYSSTATVPIIVAFALLPFGWFHGALAFLAGGAIGLGFTPTILLMQRLVPRRMGAASGIALGVSFGAGALGNLITGFVGDAAGLPVAFSVIAAGQVGVLGTLRWIPGAARRAFTPIGSPSPAGS